MLQLTATFCTCEGAHFAALIHDIHSDGLLCDHVPPAQSSVGDGVIEGHHPS
jgi:hypothetical protein